MATEEEVRFSYTLDAQDLFDKLKKIDGVSAEEARKMASNFDQATKRMARAAKKASQATKKAQAQQVKDIGEGFRKFASVAQGEVGRVTSAVLDGVESLAAFAKGLGPVGLGLLGLTATVAGFGVALAASAKVSYDLVRASGAVLDNAEKLERIGSIVPVTKEEIEDVRNANAAIDTMGDAISAAAFEVGAFLANELEPMFTVMAAGAVEAARLTDRVVDLWEAFNDSTGTGDIDNSLVQYAVALGLISRESVKAVREAQGMAAQRRAVALAEANAEKVTKRSAAALRKRNEEEREAERLAKKRAAAIEGLQGVVDSALRGENAIEGAYARRIEKIEELERISGDHAAAQDARDAAEVIRSEQLAELATKRLEEERRAYEERAKNAEAEMAREDRLAKERKRIDDELDDRRKSMEDDRIATAFAFADIAETITKRVSRAMKEGSQAQKAAAIAAFVVTQASGLSQIAVNTIVAANRAVAELGPIAGPIAAGLITATGLGQGIAVATEPPPSFHLGGTPSSTSAVGQPDVVQANILKGERVQTPEQQRQEQVGGTATISAQVVIGHEVVDRQTENALRRPTSVLSKRLAKGTHPGRGGYRGG